MKAALFLCVATLSAFAASQPVKTIVDVLQQNDNKDRFSTLVQAAQAAGLLENLQKGGPITIFAPTNDAFKKLPEGTIPKLLSTPSDLKKILSMHIVSGAIAAQNLKDGNLTAADGSTLKIAIGDDKVVTVNGAKVIPAAHPDMNTASNGIIYAIDRVILP